jgi:hypothetical protein
VSSKPTEQIKSEPDAADLGEDPHEQELTPGAVLDHGRYRLLTQVGCDARCHAQLWRAKDGVLGRDVALTILVGDRDDSDAASGARRTLERAMHASTFNHLGVARVLDVVTNSPGDPSSVLGMVIAEWTHGSDLLDLVAEGPLPPGTAARLLQPLAAAVEAAHHAGLVLGSDHPQRIRVTTEGEIRMAFPGPLPRATSSEDVRGLGAALYLLLTGKWALEGGPEGLPSAPTGPDGTVIAPRTLRPTVPMELSTVAVRALGNPDSTGSGVRTGAAVLRVLEQYATFESVGSPIPTPGHDSADNEVWRREDPAPDHDKRRKLMISVSILSAATLLVIGWIIVTVIGLFAGSGQNAGGPGKIINPDVGAPSSAPANPSAAPIQIASAAPFSPGPNPDNSSDRVINLYDGNPATLWSTQSYFQQFGPRGLRNGTGVILNLAAPAVVRQVVIQSPSVNTTIEIRSATSDQPDLASSTVLGHGTVAGPSTTIELNQAPATQHLIVWITQLGSNNGQFTSQIGEVTVAGTSS